MTDEDAELGREAHSQDLFSFKVMMRTIFTCKQEKVSTFPERFILAIRSLAILTLIPVGCGFMSPAPYGERLST
jgi:hypothetical protein